MLWPALNLGVDLQLFELVAQPGDRVFDVGFALAARLGDALDDVAIRLGIEIAQTHVFDLPLDLPNPETVRDRRVDVERLARDRLLFGRRKARQRAHVVQAVGELDDDDADVLGHRQEHFAQVLDLRVFLRLIRNARELRDAVDEPRDLLAELLGDLLAGDRRVFDDVVQQRGRDRLTVHLELGQDAGDGQRVLDVRLARGAPLTFVSGVGKLVDAHQPVRVGGRIVGTDALDKLGMVMGVPLLYRAWLIDAGLPRVWRRYWGGGGGRNRLDVEPVL